MEHIVSGPTGIIHLIVSIVAMLSGLFVLIATKGTKIHKRIYDDFHLKKYEWVLRPNYFTVTL